MGEKVKVLKKGEYQSIQPFGLFYWYLVQYDPEDKRSTAWVFGAFLEPVESPYE